MLDLINCTVHEQEFEAGKNIISRVEIIDPAGRSYVKLDVMQVEISIQDDGRTMKIFID